MTGLVITWSLPAVDHAAGRVHVERDGRTLCGKQCWHDVWVTRVGEVEEVTCRLCRRRMEAGRET